MNSGTAVQIHEHTVDFDAFVYLYIDCATQGFTSKIYWIEGLVECDAEKIDFTHFFFFFDS